MNKWDEKYSVEIQSIDNQHKELFKLLSDLLQAMKQGQANHITSKIILELEKYALIHFQKEEFFFQRFNYAGTADHIREHQIFLQKLVILKSELKSNRITLSFDLMNFLNNWIDHHILEVDKKYIECFKENGLR